MRSPRIIRIFLLLPCALVAQPDRITVPIDARRTVVLRGNVHPMAQPRFDQGPVEPAFRLGYITLMLKKTDAQQAALEQLLQQQQDPASPNYHDWLTPEQYADRFGLSQSDLDKISAWLRSQGFTVEYVARARNWVAFSGTAAQVRTTFRTEVHRYRVAGESHFAASAEPSLPASLEPVVEGLLGLDDFYPKAPHRLWPANTAADGSHSLAPGDLATIYDIGKLYQANIDGTGQRIVVVGQSAVNPLDIQGFRTKYNLPSLNLQTRTYGSSDPGITDDQSEADLDLEWAGAVAPNAALIYVYGHNADSAVFYAMDNNLAPVISESFGGCEAQASSFGSSYESHAKQANAQGITWLAASGDSGAAGCDYTGNTATQGLAVSFPASVPEVTAVGGTEFNEGSARYWNSSNGLTGGSALSYIPEMAWNDTSPSRGLLATGGGASFLYQKPAWQTGPGVPNDGFRDVPDVSLSAGVYNDPYNVLSEGGWDLYGGTSASTPVLAAIVTLLNQYLVAKGVQSKPGVGNINPTLYKLAQSAPNAFHDITADNNIVPCWQGSPDCAAGQLGYSAGPGYDLTTGLGSVDAYNLVTQWNSGPVTSTTTTVTANPASVTAGASTVLTAVVMANTGNIIPTGSVTFTLGSVSLGIVNLTVSGGVATASLTVFASQLTAGNNTIAASYAATNGFLSSSGWVTVSLAVSAIGTTTTLTATPASIGASGSTTLTATLKADNSGTTPTGSVAFKLGGTSLGAASLSGSGGAATASLSVNGSQLTIGSNTITAWYTGSGALLPSSSSVTVNVTAPAVTLKMPAITNAASYALGAVSPGENVVIWGTNIGPPTLTYGALTAGGTMLNTSAGKTRVLFDGVPAPIVYALATQTSVIVPYEVAAGPTTRVIVEYQGAQSDTLKFNVVAAVPGIYTQNQQGFGLGAILNQDGVTVNGTNAPAPKGSIVSVYMTGEGQTSPPGVTGAIVPVDVPVPWKKPQLRATATVCGFPAAVQYYGSAPGMVSGIMQVNLQIPPGANLPSGPAPMVITLTHPLTGASFSTQAQVTVSVQ